MRRYMVVFLVIGTILLVHSGFAYGGHFGKPPKTVVFMHIAGYLSAGGEVVMPGDEVGIFTGDGRLVGKTVVKKEGYLSNVAISGDIDSTDEIEGAKVGERLEIRVWHKRTRTLYDGKDIKLWQLSSREGIFTPYSDTALTFKPGGYYLISAEIN